MEKTNMGINPLNDLAIQFQNQTQHAVGGGVLRPEIDVEIAHGGLARQKIGRRIGL
jgi:hypothetical protein